MKRVKNSDIKFKINKKLVYLPNFVIRFYTVNQKEYFFEKTQDDLVSYEREATVDDVEVILSGGTTVTEYYLPLNWSELLFVGQGILNYKLTNNIEDPEFPDYQYNKEEVVTTDFYIDSIKVDPEPDESLIERVIQLEEHLDEEIVNREEADAAISGAVDSEIARAISAETALDVKIDDEIERAISAETLIVDALEEEANRAISAETALDAKIDQEIADRIADVNAEEARAINAESALTDTINAEANRAISAETALDTKIDAEANRATSAETALQTAINDEATARANADTALQTAITNEESRAREAESAITNALNAEATRATGAENALDTKIDAETTRATGAEAALDVKIDTVSGNVISETTRATTAENALSGAIDSISAATSGSVEELDAKIDQEIADRTADVDAEETRAKGVEDVLSGAIDTIDAKFIDDAKYEMSGQTHVINFYNGNTVKATIDCTDFIKDGMISTVELIPSGSTSVLVITWNTDGGSKVTTIDIGDIFEADNYYQKSETSGATEIANALALKLAISDFNTYSGAVDTLINSKASQSTVDALNGVVTAHTADTSIHLTSGDVQSQIDNSISGKVNVSDNVVSAYSFDKSTKIEYLDAAAWQVPLIPDGTKKISIGFTMLPANNQLFETLQFVTFNPFGIVDVASGLTVGVSEDMSTFPITYTITSVTWTGDDSIMAYDLSENDTLLNLYALGEYQLAQAKPNGNNIFNVYIDVLEDIESGQTAEVVNDGVVKNFENIGKYLQDERNRVDNKIDNKLDATAYTPVVSSIMQGSTNPVEGGALFDELRVQTSSGGGETTIAFDSSNYSTNYPLGCTSLKVNVGAVDEFVIINFYNGSNTYLGEISVANFGGIEVTNNTLPGATYEISGNVVTLSYPPQGITKIKKRYSENFSFSAVNPPVYDTLKNVVDAKQDQLVSSVNIKTINNESILGAGNIDIQGGGKAIEAGRGISITTGETADTVSFDLPISAGTGQNSIIIGDERNISSGNLSVAEGSRTSAMTNYAHSEGSRTLASGSYSTHAEGSQTSATSEASHSEGYQTTASGQYSHSEGRETIASGMYSHSEGRRTSATTSGAHSEGSGTLASGQYSHSEGKETSASGGYSHSEGFQTTASGEGSHSEGKGTIALNKYEHSEGYFNVSSSGSSTFGDSGNTLFSVGNGTADNARHNAFEIRQNGDIYLTKDGQDVKLQDQLGGGGGITSGEVQTMIESATTPIYQTIEENEEVTAEALNVLNAALSGKADSSDVYLKSETSGATEISTALATKQNQLTAGSGIEITAANVISVTGGTGGGISSAECQTMIDQSISGKTNQSDFTGHTADTTIHVTAQDKTNWNNKSDFSGDYNDLTNKPTIPTVPTNVSDFTNDAGYITSNDISGKTNQSDFTAHTANTTVHVTSTEKATWNAKSDFSGNYNDLTNKPTIPSKTSDLTNDSNFATTGDVQTATNDMATKTWVGQQGYLTQHQDISGKQDVSGMTAYTQNSTFNAYTAATNSALANKQNQLTPGTGISIQNDVISVTASSPSVDAYTKAESDAKFATITNFNSHSGNTTAHITSAERTAWNAKSDFSGSYNDLTDKPTIPNYTAGSGITISNNVISAKIWSGTQAQYDALAVKDNDTIYLIYNS